MGSNPEDLAAVVAVMVSNNNGEDSNPAPVIMDPRLQMAARNGDCQMLENLLVHHQLCGQTASSDVESHFVIHLPEIISNTDATVKRSSHQPNKKIRGVTKYWLSLQPLTPTTLVKNAFVGYNDTQLFCVFGRKKKTFIPF
jgi:hypothetical protein